MREWGGRARAFSRNGKIRMENWLAFRERNYRDSVHVHRGRRIERRAQSTCTGNVFGERGVHGRAAFLSIATEFTRRTPSAKSFRRGLLPRALYLRATAVRSRLQFTTTRPAHLRFLNYPTQPPVLQRASLRACAATLRVQTSIPVSFLTIRVGRKFAMEHS